MGGPSFVRRLPDFRRVNRRQINMEKISENKKWQPVNIILGTVLIGLIFYYCFPKSSFLTILRIIPAAILIFTRKNNIIFSIILFLSGMTIFVLPTLDAFLLLVIAVYVFSSAILRMLKVKMHILFGLIVALILGMYLFLKLTHQIEWSEYS